MNPLAIIRPGITRGPWVLCTQNGGTILWESPRWDRVVEVARDFLAQHRWDLEIDGAAS